MKTSAVSSAKMVLACAVIAVLVIQLSLTEARRTKNCGLTCYRWRKCKASVSVLSNTGGATRPGQRGTTGQLFFAKCGDPPEGCGCKYEEPKVPTKPKFPELMLEYVNEDAREWITNLVDVI